MMDPNYIKLFKMSQLTIEYLVVRNHQSLIDLFDFDLTLNIFLKHSQNYLSEVISTIEEQLNKSLLVNRFLDFV